MFKTVALTVFVSPFFFGAILFCSTLVSFDFF